MSPSLTLFVRFKSGFNDFIWEKDKVDTWTCEEILTPIALSQEGRILHHCVFSYHSSVEKGIVSIWSLRLNDERRITIEVQNASRKIVQVRGLQNRKAKHEEMKVILMWANTNRLSISSWI